MSIREAAQAVIDVTDQEGYCGPETIGYAIEALRAALAEPQGEPVAWGMLSKGVIVDAICPEEHDEEEGDYTVALYDHPAPLRELRDEEIIAVSDAMDQFSLMLQDEIVRFARAIIDAARKA